MHMRQRIAAQKVLESKGLKPVSQAMIEAGYPPTTAKNPQQLTKSKGWQELMDKYLPDDKLLKVHEEGLEATKVVSAIIVGKDADSKTNDFIDVPDYPTRAKYLELGYKVKHKVDQPVQFQSMGDMTVEFTLDESQTAPSSV